AAAVRTRPTAKRQPWNLLTDELPQLVGVLDASGNRIALVAADHHHRGKTQGIGSLRKPEAIIQRMFGRENRNNPRAVCFGAKVDGNVPEIRLFAAADRPVR